MSLVPQENLNVYIGQNKEIIITILGDAGLEVVTGDTLEFYVLAPGDSTPIITKTTADVAELEITGDSEVTVKLIPSDTSSLTAGRYYYQLWHIDINGTGDKYPALTGFFDITSLEPSILPVVRHILDEGAELGIRQIRDEVVPPTDLYTVHTFHRRVTAVQGVWLSTDIDHSGTNYYGDGGFEEKRGKITLGVELPDIVNDVRINYTWESGISDETIQHHLFAAKAWVEEYSGDTFNYNAESDKKPLENMAIAYTIIMCVLTMNGGNVAQMGYNFRVGEFEVQTKLWGEGMIAGELFKQYTMELERWMSVVGKYVRFNFARNIKKYRLSAQLDYLGQSSSISDSEGSED